MLETILDLATIFRASGKELYMVGGTVRDLLLRRETTSPDIDLTTNARPDEIKRLVAGTHPAAVFSIGEKFGTVRIHYRRALQTDDAAEPGEQDSPSTETTATSPEPVAIVPDHPADVDIVEITTYRSDRYDPDSRKPEVTFGDTLEDDLLRRDFTINAMARDPLSGAILDPYGGRADIERRLIRAVGDDPERRFDEDPLRMLRAVRFAAQLDFQIEEATAQAIARQAATLGKISRERIRDEFTKALTTPRPDLAIRLIVDLGLAPWVMPEVLELRGVSQQPTPKPPRSKDVYAHVLRVVVGIPNRPATRWAALLHDIAKPRTRSVENGQVHFFGHEDVGAVMARDILRRLKFDKPFIDHVSRLVKLHMRANGYLPDWTDGAVRRLMIDAGDALPDLLDLSRADITSYRPEKVARAVARINELEARCNWLREEAERVPIRSPLDGNDLMELFGRGPGPWLRPIKDHLLDLVIDGQLAPDDREDAAREAQRFLAEFEAPSAAMPTVTGEATGAAQTAPGQPAQQLDGAQPAATPTIKRAARAANRRQSRSVLPAPSEPTNQQPSAPTAPERPIFHTRAASQRRASNPLAPNAPSADAAASRDEIVAFLDEYLNISRFRDVAPNGMQVIGKPGVRRIALGVSANLALFEAAVAEQADLILVHHGLFLARDPQPILAGMKARLKLLFDNNITLLGYHLPLDAHPEVGNNVQWLRRLGFAVESLDFAPYQGQFVGAIGVCESEPLPFTELAQLVKRLAGHTPKVYAYGPPQVRRLAIATGAAAGNLGEAMARGCDAFLTGEVAEGTQALACEAQANFIAAGHYNTERFGVQALGDMLRDRFGVATVFIDVPNDV